MIAEGGHLPRWVLPVIVVLTLLAIVCVIGISDDDQDVDAVDYPFSPYIHYDGITYHIVSQEPLGHQGEVEVADANADGTPRPAVDPGTTSVDIPESFVYLGITFNVVGIGPSAFEDCTSLRYAFLPVGLETISERAFYGCTKLDHITIPITVRSIGAKAFEGCTAMSYANIGGNVSTINADTFSGCTSLETVYVSINTTSIRERAFENCSNLRTVVASPQNYNRYDFTNIESIGDRSFAGCTSLNSISVGKLRHIGENAFEGTGVLTITVVEYVHTKYVYISEGAFSGRESVNFLPRDDLDTLVMLNENDEVIDTLVGYVGAAYYGWNIPDVPDEPEPDVPDEPEPDVPVDVPTYLFEIVMADGVVHSDEYEVGATVSLPDHTSQAGYEFGWISDYVTITNDSFTMPGNFVLVRETFEPLTFTITFDTAGGSEIPPITQEYMTSIDPPDDPTRDGYRFNGWSPRLPITMPSYDLKVTAQWTEIPVETYPVTFTDQYLTVTANGAEVDSTDMLPTGTRLSIELGERAGYTGQIFINGAPLYGNTTVIRDSGVRITVEWSGDMHTVTYVSDGIEYHYKYSYATGETVTTLELPETIGRTFGPWTSEDVNIVNGRFVMPNHDVRVTTISTPNTYTVTFDSNGGSPVPPMELEYGERFRFPEDPVRDGYEFVGWSGAVLTMPARDVTMVAQWVQEGEDTYTIYLEPNDGTQLDPIVVGENTDRSLPELTREGYAFDGWFTEPEFEHMFFFGYGTEDITLYAKWTIQSYMVIYMAEGRTVGSEQYEYGETVTVRDKLPSNSVVTYGDWYTDDATVVNGRFTMPANGVTFYTDTTPFYCIVEFVTNTGQDRFFQDAPYDGYVTEPDEPFREGYEFTGWYTDSSCTARFDFSDRVTEDMTLYAGWRVASEDGSETETPGDDPSDVPSEEPTTPETPDDESQDPTSPDEDPSTPTDSGDASDSGEGGSDPSGSNLVTYAAVVLAVVVVAGAAVVLVRRR